MTHPITSTSEVTDVTAATVAFDLATDAFAAARHLQWASEAEEGAKWALRALEDIPEDLRAQFAECIDFVRDTASAILAESESVPPWNRRMHQRCEELADVLNAISDAIARKIRAAAPPPKPQRSPHRQHKPHKPTPAYLAALASKPGIARVEKRPDGTVVVIPGEPSANDTEANPWDEVLINAADQKRPS